MGADAAVGKCTYVGSRGSSLIDYVITNQEFLKHFSNFYVNDPNIMSDHCLLNFELNFKVLETHISASVSENDKNESQFCNGKYVWVNDKTDVFLNELQSESIKQQLNNIFDSITQAIRITCPCNEHPLTPHFYIEKVGFTRVYIFFLFLLQNIDCGYSLEPPR